MRARTTSKDVITIRLLLKSLPALVLFVVFTLFTDSGYRTLCVIYKGKARTMGTGAGGSRYIKGGIEDW